MLVTSPVSLVDLKLMSKGKKVELKLTLVADASLGIH